MQAAALITSEGLREKMNFVRETKNVSAEAKHHYVAELQSEYQLQEDICNKNQHEHSGACYKSVRAQVN